MAARPKRQRTSSVGAELVDAAKKDELRRVRQLLQRLNAGGSRVDGRDTIRRATALFWAVDNDNASMVTALLNAGANVNATDCDDVTATHHACFLGHEDALRELLVAQPDLTLKNNEGKLPIDDAVNKGHNGCARMLQNAALQQ